MLFNVFDTASEKVPYVAIDASDDLVVRLVHSSIGEDVDQDFNLSHILAKASQSGCGPLIVFEADDHGVFIVCAGRCSVSSTTSFDTMIRTVQDFIRNCRQHQMCMLYQLLDEEGVRENLLEADSCSNFVTLTRYESSAYQSLGLSVEDQKTIAQSISPSDRVKRKRPRFELRRVVVLRDLALPWHFSIIVMLVLMAILLSIFASRFTPSGDADELHSWVAYDTRGSSGPKYQLSINGENASTFTSSSTYLEGEWTLRIDDQALIPLHLLSDSEKHYQQWYRKRYPNIERDRLSQRYLNETWLSSNAVEEVMVDDHFHFSHCVLAVKRFIEARDTGRHVCGRDIDRDHVHHCLEALDWWAFPEGRMGESVPNPKRPFGWRTKVCFD